MKKNILIPLFEFYLRDEVRNDPRRVFFTRQEAFLLKWDKKVRRQSWIRMT